MQTSANHNAPALNNLTSLTQARALLDQLIAQAAATKGLGAKPPVKAPTTRQAIEAQQDARLLAVVQGKTLWLPEATAQSGLSKQVAQTAAKRLAYAERIWLTLEPGPKGKLTSRLRSRERMVAE